MIPTNVKILPPPYKRQKRLSMTHNNTWDNSRMNKLEMRNIDRMRINKHMGEYQGENKGHFDFAPVKVMPIKSVIKRFIGWDEVCWLRQHTDKHTIGLTIESTAMLLNQYDASIGIVRMGITIMEQILQSDLLEYGIKVKYSPSKGRYIFWKY
jgi:hypothetical protein